MKKYKWRTVISARDHRVVKGRHYKDLIASLISTIVQLEADLTCFSKLNSEA